MQSALSKTANYLEDTIKNENSGQRWTTTFGTPNHNDGVYDLIEDYDKGYYMVGYDVITSGNGKGWNIKTDINGSLLWDQKLTHPQFQYIGWCGINDSLGNKYVAGVAFMDDSWPFVVKFNPCGEKLWCTLFKDWGKAWGSPIDIIINHEGNILVLSRFEEVDFQQINQIYLLCYSPDGDLLWAKPYASKNDHPLIAFAYCTKLYQFVEDYILSGYCYYPYPDNPNHVWLRPLFIGIDSQFNEKWIMPYGMNDSIIGEAYSAIPLNDSVIMGVGNFHLEQSGYYGRSSSMMFFNHAGDEMGFTVIERDSIIPGTLGNTLYQMETINDSLFFATAVIGPNEIFNPWGEMVIDTSGKVYNVQPRPNTRGFSSLVKTFDNKYVIACGINEPDMNHTDIILYKLNANLEHDTIYTQNFVYDSLCPYPIVSGDIDMTDCVLQVGLEEIPTPEQYYARLDAIPITAYPNPANSIINFDYKNTERHQNMLLQCYNAIGKEVYSEEISTAQQGSRLDVSHWYSGIYIAVVTSQGKVAGKVKFVVR